MTTQTKKKILDALGDASIWLTVASALPYSMGDAATVLGPKAKVYMTVGGVVIAGLAKFVQHTISIFASVQDTPAPIGQASGANPLMTNPPVQGPNKLP